MPPAKKPAARTGSRSSASSSNTGAITRKEVEAATARFEKALDDASQALQSMGTDLGRGGKSAYREIERMLKTLRRDARKTNRSLLKDFDKLRAAVTPSKPSTGSTRTKSTGTKSTAKTPARSTSKSAAAKKPARSGSKSAAAKAPARSANKSTASGSARTATRKPSASRRSS